MIGLSSDLFKDRQTIENTPYEIYSQYGESQYMLFDPKSVYQTTNELTCCAASSVTRQVILFSKTVKIRTISGT